MPIGILDSGLGGLTVLASLRARFPEQGFIYLGDQANAPYGERSPEDIHKLTRIGVARLFEAGCGLVVIACNTAAAVALRALQGEWLAAWPGRRVLGVLVPVIESLVGRPWHENGPPVPVPVNSVGLFATPATVASGAFYRELALRASGLQLHQQGCPGLVEVLEAGGDPAPIVTRDCRSLRDRCAAPDIVVLGCTHYPLVEEMFRAALPNWTHILSQPAIVTESLGGYLDRHPRFRGTGELTMVTTGNPCHVSARSRTLLGSSFGTVAFAAA